MQNAYPGLVDWPQFTGQSELIVSLVTIPVFSAVAGLLTNFTGVWMLFTPVRFVGFRVPGLRSIYPWLPRRLQSIPIFASGGRLGFQGFIPARNSKMASLTVDKAILKIGGPSDFYHQLEPEAIAEQFAVIIAADLREVVDSVMTSGYPYLWPDLPASIRGLLYARVSEELPDIAVRAFAEIGRNIDELLNVKTMVIDFLANEPSLLKDIIYKIGAPELRFMVGSGLLGFPLGVLLAVYLHIHSRLPLLHHIPDMMVVLAGAAAIGTIVNIVAVRVVFTPAERRSRFIYPWGQSLFARRQHDVATDFAHAIAHQVITMPTIVAHLLNGPNGDKTRILLHQVLAEEIDRIQGRMRPLINLAVGSRRLSAIQSGSAATALRVIPALAENPAFNRSQAQKIDRLCTQKLRALQPREFVELLYCAVEQDAWLLYLHGAALGMLVGTAHLILFGA
ncbi:hypothetical protein ACWIGW_41355 [Nocardia brasiliensis]